MVQNSFKEYWKETEKIFHGDLQLLSTTLKLPPHLIQILHGIIDDF